MNENTAAATPEPLHPDWCQPSACEVQIEDGDHYFGDHFQAADRVTTQYGATFGIALTCNACDESNPYVGLRISTSESSEPGVEFAWQSETYHFEPEEMLLLARRMTEAAHAWQRVRRNQPVNVHPITQRRMQAS